MRRDLHVRFVNLSQSSSKLRTPFDSMARIQFLIAMVLSLTSAASAVGQDSIYPDKNLEAVVRHYVFEKRNTDKPVVEKDVETISTITGKNKKIANLAGMEKCRSLALLDLEGNEIVDLGPIKDLTNIQSLNLAGNKIQDIKPLENLKGLQYLHLAGNEIRDLAPLAKLENLRSLYLSNNQIQDIKPLAGLKKLWSLYIDGNKIEDISALTGLTKIDSLDLRGNQIEEISPLSGFTELKYLFLDNNKITDLSILVQMAKKDIEGDTRFAPFLNLFVFGNPLSEDAKNKQIEELKAIGVRFPEYAKPKKEEPK